MAEFKDRGNHAYQAGQYASAIDLYTEGIEHEPTNAALFSNRSAAFLKLEEYGKAKRDADMCIELQPLWAKGWWRKGTAQFEDQDYQGARETFSQGLVRCPADENLKAGVEKATKYIAAVNAVEAPGDVNSHFNPDQPSKRNPPETSSTPTSNSTPNGDVPQNSSPEKSSADQTAAWPATPEHEIERINQAPNHYAVLHVSTETNNTEMKKNYYALARMLHPDKCQLEGAENAMTSVSQAYDTLTNVIKRTLYDQYLSQTGDDAEHAGQTYQEWESRQEPVELPKWLNWLLNAKGVGWLLLVFVCILCIPIILIVFLIMLLINLLMLPYQLTMACCFPERYRTMKEEQEKKLAKEDEAFQDRNFAHV